MNTPYFIAQRILRGTPHSFTGIASKIAIGSIALSIAILILTISILSGFKDTITNKLYSFDGHVQISPMTMNSDFTATSLPLHSSFYDNAKQIPYIDHIQQFAYLKGVVHCNEKVAGIIVKGFGDDCDTNRLKSYLTQGTLPHDQYDIVLSEVLANQLEYKTKDKIIFYSFKDGKFKPRKLNVVGIYNTFMEEFDQRIILGNIKMIQSVNDWAQSDVGGYEVYVKQPDQLNILADSIYQATDYNMNAISIQDKYSDVFVWLELLDMNVNIFVFLIFVIAFLNIVSTKYIFIKERTNMIGMLTSFGGSKIFIQKIFWFTGFHLLAKGVILGNFIGLGICALLFFFHVIPLDPDMYYMDYVPVSWQWTTYIWINIGTIIIVAIILLIPAYLATKVDPIKSIKFY